MDVQYRLNRLLLDVPATSAASVSPSPCFEPSMLQANGLVERSVRGEGEGEEEERNGMLKQRNQGELGRPFTRTSVSDLLRQRVHSL